MFTYCGLEPKDGCIIANMKCSTEHSAELMERYDGIFFGRHSDRKYWITVALDSDVPDSLICELILHSVEEVVKKMPKKMQREYESLTE